MCTCGIGSTFLFILLQVPGLLFCFGVFFAGLVGFSLGLYEGIRVLVRTLAGKWPAFVMMNHVP